MIEKTDKPYLESGLSQLTRRTFMKESAFATVAVGMTKFAPSAYSDDKTQPVAAINGALPLAAAAAENPGPIRPPHIIPMLWGEPRLETNLDAWFQSMKQWGVRQWMSYGTSYRPNRGKPEPPMNPNSLFLENAWPGFTPQGDLQALAAQEAAVRKAADLCVSHGIDFWYLLPFPLFPTNDRAYAEKAAPYFFQSGKVNLYEPRLAELLKAEVRQIKKALPAMKGFTLLFAEGAGTMGNLTPEDLAHNQEWQTPLIHALNEVTRELKIQGMVSGHHYLETVRDHRNVYEGMAGFPELIIMDDTTWPEEDMLHPVLGYLPEQDRELLFRTNPVALKVLLDTEYLGQGVLPSVYPRWWKYNVQQIVEKGTKIAIGRTFFWDGGYTDINFNRLNAYAFVHFCYDPDANPREVLGEAAREMFAPRIPERLIDILWETEPVIKEVIGVDGVDSLMHSRFPLAAFLDVVYTPQNNAMKAVDDLFRPPGTKLYPPLTNALNNYKQWRWQNKTVSEPAETYIAAKREAKDWLQGVLPEVRQLAAALNQNHRKMFIDGYEILACLSNGMEIFVETAAVHYDWAHGKTISDREARARFNDLSSRLRAAAAQAPENPFLYRDGMLAFAEFLETKLPRIGTRC